MRIRYKKESNGSSTPIAKIYTIKEHGISNSAIDSDALWAVKKLQQANEEAYIVGGAVRDILLGERPKDFDIATSATPRKIQKLFWNARIIGKRFRLVHLLFNEKIIEVSTFRSGVEQSDNALDIYGSIDQDAKRRDFSINSLYFDPINKQLIDFNSGLDDFKRKRIRSVLPLPHSFIEDPVRMVRAIKYSVTTNFPLQGDIKRSIRKCSGELARISSSRLTEEISKILISSHSAPIIRELQKYRLLVYLLPCISVSNEIEQIYRSLERLDTKLLSQRSGDEHLSGEMLLAVVEPLLTAPIEGEKIEILFKETFNQIKKLITPITPPNYYVEEATTLFLQTHNLTVPKQCLKSRRPIRPNIPISKARTKKSYEQQKRKARLSKSAQRRKKKQTT